MRHQPIFAALLMIALPAQAAQSALPTAPCLTEPELRAGLAFAMQEMMVAISSKCAPILAESSYLRAKGSQLIARYSDTASNSNEILNNLVKRLGPELKIADGDPVAMKGVASTMIAQGLGKLLTNEKCDDVDKALALLDPMPPENIIGLIEFAIEKVEASDRAKGKRTGLAKRPLLCPAGKSATPNVHDR